MAKETQIQKFVQSCRTSHGGPLNAPEEVDELVAKLQHDPSTLRTALTKEIRYRKYSSFSIKFNNPLFDQQKLNIESLTTNLKLLLMKTDSTLAAKATMSDLQEAIVGHVDQVEEFQRDVSDSAWPPAIGDHIAANFTDGFYIGEVVSVVDEDIVNVSYMRPKIIATANDEEHPRRFMCWPKPKDLFKTHRDCVLNLHPSIALAIPPSTKKMVIFSCLNVELLEALANCVTEEI